MGLALPENWILAKIVLDNTELMCTITGIY